MGMGWKHVSGGEFSRNKCKCGCGKVIIYVSDHEESDYSLEDRGAIYRGETTCPYKCVDLENMTQDELKFYR